MVTELQLQTNDNSVFGEVDTTEAAWDQEELPKVKPSSNRSIWYGKGLLSSPFYLMRGL